MALPNDPRLSLFGGMAPQMPSQTPQGVQVADLSYMNQGATRNQKVIPLLEKRLNEAVDSVYGPGFVAQIYSGGQAGRGEGGKRTGSVRHDHGKAADIYIQGPDGKRLTGDALAPLGQYWAAKKYGGVGMEMRGGGVHLDAWETPPPGGGMSWNYAGQGGRFTPTMRNAISAGLAGNLPGSMAPSSQIASQEPSPPQPSGTPAPALGPGQMVADAPIAPPQQAAEPIPQAVAQAAAPPAAGGQSSPMQILGSLAMMQQPEPLPPPPPIQGPSPQQATALSSFIQALMSRSRQV